MFGKLSIMKKRLIKTLQFMLSNLQPKGRGYGAEYLIEGGENFDIQEVSHEVRTMDVYSNRAVEIKLRQMMSREIASKMELKIEVIEVEGMANYRYALRASTRFVALPVKKGGRSNG